MDVKLFEQDGELYVLAKSEGRRAKETAMRRKRLVRLLKKLRALRRNLPSRDQLLMRLGAAKSAAGRALTFSRHQTADREVEIALAQPAATASCGAKRQLRNRSTDRPVGRTFVVKTFH